RRIRAMRERSAQSPAEELLLRWWSLDTRRLDAAPAATTPEQRESLSLLLTQRLDVAVWLSSIADGLLWHELHEDRDITLAVRERAATARVLWLSFGEDSYKHPLDELVAHLDVRLERIDALVDALELGASEVDTLSLVERQLRELSIRIGPTIEHYRYTES